ncbi:MAG: hypothetical protein JXM70_01860 [Pirellulales bacterium]|nr:hypothetical protein [Pirellulales bacterium]
MSDNPFREITENPYASPSEPAQANGGNPLMIPAIILLSLAALFILFLIASIPSHVMRWSEVDLSTPQGAGELTGGIATLVIWMVLTVAIIVGSINMLRLRGYRTAMTAAIVAMIPICSPCFVLGIPFGIWAIVLLRKPEVQRRFS